MKKIFLSHFIFFILIGFAAKAQFAPLGPPVIKPTPVKVLTSPGLESAPTRTTPLPLTDADYLMTSVKVTIKTGSDNKEALSNVTFELAVRDTAYSIFAQNNCNNEFKINTENTIGLEGIMPGSMTMQETLILHTARILQKQQVTKVFF